MPMLLTIAIRHLLDRKRQSVVSLMGIVLGVAFFLAIASLMKGSENDFIRRLIDNAPHITIQDNYRAPRAQPLYAVYKSGALELRHVTPLPENRGIRGYHQLLEALKTRKGVEASPQLTGQGIISFAGQDVGVALSGMIPAEIETVTTIKKYMIEGEIADLSGNPDGIIIGAGLSQKYGINMAETLTITAGSGQVRTFKVVGMFRTGRASYDESQAFIDISRAQALFGRLNRANGIIIKLADPYSARTMAAEIERAIGYKAVSWQESSEDILSTLVIRNIIMYTVVGAVLLVAAFGIYNVISTVVSEKQRDIAILKAMGFEAGEIQQIFLFQGIMLGLCGVAAGIPLGCSFMLALMQVQLKPPGSSEVIHMPLDWGWPPFAIAAAFAMSAAMFAAYMPARKAARIEPVDILRGGF
ncbi:MAG: FtsX-like permease family protein [Proteobacteria bacterium]|nr:FtsX-like permease family protein [Pseudomonadota bacterium]